MKVGNFVDKHYQPGASPGIVCRHHLITIMGVDPLSYFSFQPVLHDWCNKGCGMCNPVCGMVHIKEPLLLIGKSSPCGGSGFPLSLSEWSFTICPTPYNRKIKCVECVVKETFPSFHLNDYWWRCVPCTISTWGDTLWTG